MLLRIEIQNYAIIEKLDITFPPGLTIITGETGAGKSILLGALGLIMGNRADAKVMYDSSKKTYVEATFDIKNYKVKDFFLENDLEYFDELLIRREISIGGKSRAFINDTPTTLEILSSLSEKLVEIHQQFDSQDIQRASFQMEILDALASNQALLQEYQNEFKAFKQLRKTYEEKKVAIDNQNAELEYLQFLYDELIDANLQIDEKSELEGLLLKQSATEDIKKFAAMAVHVIENADDNVVSKLISLNQHWSSLKSIDVRFQDLYERLSKVVEELHDLAREASNIEDETDFEPEAIQTTQDRLNNINRLEKKHKVNEYNALLEIRKALKSKLDGNDDAHQELIEMQSQLSAHEKSLRTIATRLSNNRKKIIPAFEENVRNSLISLSMPNANLKIELNAISELTDKGSDEIRFLFAPNKGSDFLPVKQTASGGELSRLALSIKSLLAGALTLPTLIFDEIDSGVSGEVAHRMSTILQSMSKNHQMICITHSPQIASKADVHYWVHKKDIEDRTITMMKLLTEEGRINEIAKMLSGDPPSEIAKANAKELIGI